jgi:hypothetical protein
MSQGKYSPSRPQRDGEYEYKFNCRGQVPPDYDHTKDVFDTQLHFGDYDEEGFDRYGYSAFDADGEYVGGGNGVDRLGYTEMEYLQRSFDEPEDVWDMVD